VPLKIFITGASSGIGAEIARQYSLLNHDNIIGLIGRNKTKLSKLHKQLDCKSLPIVADVSDFNSIETAAHLFVSEFGLPDIVIANAGVSSGTLLQNKDDIEVIEKIFKINFHGVVNTFHPFLSSFMKQK
jgi:NADP-dependent 3-hydroxy acid dehydrogenase YdfG